ncbi:MAG TPA: hypothetical protein VID74_09305 [Gemmatimonadales bacterium]|jgi:hypothetical protein
MTRFSRARRNFLFIFGLMAIFAIQATPARAQIIATPSAGAATGPRLPIQHVPRYAPLPGERSELRSRAASGTTIHLSTLAIIVGIVILVILLV